LTYRLKIIDDVELGEPTVPSFDLGKPCVVLNFFNMVLQCPSS
jgi:hypothetical protein